MESMIKFNKQLSSERKSRIPFLDQTNKLQIVNKSYDLPIRGGSITENINKPLATNQSKYFVF